MKASTLPSAVENFTIAFDKTAHGCTLRMDWGRRGHRWTYRRCDNRAPRKARRSASGSSAARFFIFARQFQIRRLSVPAGGASCAVDEHDGANDEGGGEEHVEGDGFAGEKPAK